MASPRKLPARRASGRTVQAALRASRVRLVVLDVDGVLTDGRLYFGPDGESFKVFDARDGHGVRLLREAGLRVAVLSSRASPIVERRAGELDIAPVLQGERDKLAALQRLLATTGVTAAECAYMGDDWPDLPVMANVGFAAAVADAAPEVRRAAHWIARFGGGRGAVRALAEYVLRCRRQHAPMERSDA
ncbi:MAG: HAD-IIIA family hydrolase [Burkholderiaceae bacterium]|nr:HAD-IIIA family hydrolase [Burkholderiaceae bacterium]